MDYTKKRYPAHITIQLWVQEAIRKLSAENGTSISRTYETAAIEYLNKKKADDDS